MLESLRGDLRQKFLKDPKEEKENAKEGAKKKLKKILRGRECRQQEICKRRMQRYRRQ